MNIKQKKPMILNQNGFNLIKLLIRIHLKMKNKWLIIYKVSTFFFLNKNKKMKIILQKNYNSSNHYKHMKKFQSQCENVQYNFYL